MKATYILTIVLIHIGLSGLIAQENSWQKYRNLVYQGYINNDLASWKAGNSALMKQFKSSTNLSLDLAYETVLAEYGMIGYCLASESCEDVEDRIDDAQEMLEELLDDHPKWSEGHAFLGALIAMEIGLSPAKAIFLGPGSSNHIEKAIELNANNPSAWVEMGNMRFHAPSLFGGDKEEAIICFKKAIELFDRKASLRKDNWLYLHAWVWLAKAYEETGNMEQARKSYEKVLLYEPRFTWVKDELLPQIRKKVKN